MDGSASSTTTLQQPGPNIIRLQQGITRTVKPATSGEKSFKEIPVLDVSRMYSEDLAEREKLAVEVRDAATKVGFMQIKNHGVPQEAIDAAFDHVKEFFALPLDAKMKLTQHQNPHFLGYEPLYETNVGGLKRGDCKESFSFAYDPDDDPSGGKDMPAIIRRVSQWPEPSVVPGYREALVKYQQSLLALARRFIRIFALALNLPEDHFDKMVTHPLAGVRTLHYPPMTGSDDQEIGLGAHTDIEFFTIIVQTINKHPALEVLNADGEWIKLYPQFGCFVVNLSDMMMRMTNDIFLSTVHRVINRGETDRYSIPFFFGANANELIEVLPSCTSEENPPKYEGMTTYDHSNARLRIARYQHPNAKQAQVFLPKKYVVRKGVPVFPEEQ
ncbi:uncharacterized protein PV07_04086 [Cladophialophora immunda]|uniref:Fe2OG dioxygenase domain-containing protein n=1 Tax=Cladophialophora immunda TaxID=569365 RepID=A0A0D2CRJ2_9EURO|nr:uncharacterized protein PV07_04086 [Cladophialophora immunda]KIW32555.1 hypothetical protein PV07_04086 [Cladophialophora immunda]OQU98897.1 hypothetical protein CLAIMM_04609 [Cladophialophora immunda]